MRAQDCGYNRKHSLAYLHVYRCLSSHAQRETCQGSGHAQVPSCMPPPGGVQHIKYKASSLAHVDCTAHALEILSLVTEAAAPDSP